jgi:hypothetical protein
MDLGAKSAFQDRGRSTSPSSTPACRLWKCHLAAIFASLFVLSVFCPRSVQARDKSGIDYGAGLIVSVPFPADQVAQVVRDVVQNGIIRGTKEYNKDEYVSGAAAVSETRLFPHWNEGGQVFYKQREHALDPRNFKNGGDSGTLIVRYVLQPQGDKHTVLRINAIFVEDFRHTVHQSNGSVEEAEYKDIHDRLDEISVMNSETAELQREKKELGAQKAGAPAVSAGYSSSQQVESTRVESGGAPTQEVSLAEAKAAAAAAATPQTLEERVKQLRVEVERDVKAPGAALKSAPFHTATTLQSLPTGSEVLIVITTTYWLGVETHDGQHGWIQRDELEQVK